MNPDWVWVGSPTQLEAACDSIRRVSLIGVDTEYDSFRYFREKLCLIQVISGGTTYLFDPFKDLDLAPLGDIFADAQILKVLHAGDNDIRILNRDYGFVFKNIFDTYRAASILGCTYLSLVNVVGVYLGVILNKTKKMQRSQWENRPLSKEQLEYAVQDTRYLIALHRVLEEELKRQALEEKAQEVFRGMEHIQWREKVLDPEGYLKIKGTEDLNCEELLRLKALYIWRFEKARTINKARFMIIPDQGLLGLATIKHASISALEESDLLSSQKIRAYGADIIATLAEFD